MTFSRTVELPVSPDEAFALVTEPERLRRWQTVSAYVDLRAGGAFRWTVVPGAVASGTYREVEPGRRVVMGFGWESGSEVLPDTSTLTVTIEPGPDGGSLLTLVHEGLTADQELSHEEGWNHFLDRLEKLVATGDAGADEWVWAPENLDPVTAAEAVLAPVLRVARALTPADADRPTPCSEFSVEALVDHLVASLVKLGGMADVSVTDLPDHSWEDRLAVAAAGAIDAWRTRGFEGTVTGPGGSELSASFAAGLLPVELALHGWDLAQGAGQSLELSDEVVAYLRGIADPGLERARERGSFGPEVTPAPDASPLDSLAAYAGRVALV